MTKSLLAALLAGILIIPAYAAAPNKTNGQCQQPVHDANGKPVMDGHEHAITTDCPHQGAPSHPAIEADRTR